MPQHTCCGRMTRKPFCSSTRTAARGTLARVVVAVAGREDHDLPARRRRERLVLLEPVSKGLGRERRQGKLRRDAGHLLGDLAHERMR